MSQQKQCPQCGGVLPGDAPEGLCPRCILQFAAVPESSDGATRMFSGPIEVPGTVIGPYKLLEKIGEGGMAVVYMAEQERPLRRRVALKIIKLGMDTRQVVARFDAERQALALMDHPNIARVFDAGATDAGRPYFVMELVRGLSITDYCDRNRLSMPERLNLFVPVCNAVHHAHQKGIIHRDLKPSNIMVTLHDGEPVPKVIDFGIAKATNQSLTEQTVFTRYAEMIGTPEYMSPEQAEMSGLDIDIRNYLAGAPLLAGPESTAYRVRKLLHKHRIPVATAAILLTTLLVGFATSTYLYLRVRQAQNAVVKLEHNVQIDRKLSRAQQLQAEGRYHQALTELDEYLDTEQPAPAARLLHASLLYTVDRFDEAETELVGLLDESPEVAGPAHCLLATIHMGRDPVKAQAHQQAGESLLPQTPEAYTLRGLTADGSTATVQWLSKALEQYRVCQGFGRCLVPTAFGVPAWSPDGKELAYGRIDLHGLSGGSSAPGAPLVHESGGLEVVDVATGRVRVLAPSGKCCAWSPDGQWIAFDRTPNRGAAGCASELWTIPATGGRPRFLTRGSWPIWAGRKGRVFYQSAGGADSINADDLLAEPQHVLPGPSYFAVSPDAKHLAYANGDRLFVVAIPGGEVKTTWTAPPPEGRYGMALKWAPNGKEILAGGLHKGELGLWSFDVEQGKAWQLFPSPAVLGAPSPDGLRIAVEIRDWYGGTWLAELVPADSLHEGVRSVLTEEQYLRKSCRDLAEAIRRGTYRRDADTYLRGFLTRVTKLAEDCCRHGQYEDALDTALGIEDLCKALGREPRIGDMAVAALSLCRLGRQAQAKEMLDRMRRVPQDDTEASEKRLLHEAQEEIAGLDREGQEPDTSISVPHEEGL